MSGDVSSISQKRLTTSLVVTCDSVNSLLGNHMKSFDKIILYPHFTKDYFGPDSTRSLYMVDRPHILESNRGLADNHGQSPGKVWPNPLSPTRVGYRKK